MKKSILFAILVSIFLVAGAYYYLFILNAEDETPRKPTKMRVAVQAAVTSVKGGGGAKPGQTAAGKTEMKQEVPPAQKKAEPAKPAAAQAVQAAPAAKAAASQKEPAKAETKKEQKKTEPAAVKESPKAAPEAKKAPEKKVARIRHYRVEFIASDGENATGMRETLIGKGYHTARQYKYKGRHYVVVEPFTDKWEAQYVRDSIAKEIDAGRFAVKPVY